MDRRVTKKGYTTIYNRYVKRVFDVIAAVVLLIALFPLYFIIAFAVIVDTGFPVFYRPLRGGYRNKPFHIEGSSFPV